MKKLLTILVVALLLCLVCSAALATEQKYFGTKTTAEIRGYLAVHTDKLTDSEVDVDTIISIDGNTAYAGNTLTDNTLKALLKLHAHAENVEIVLEGQNKDGKREKVYGYLQFHYKSANLAATSTSPTCVKDGVNKYKCACPDCTATYDVTVPANGVHDLYLYTKKATCVAAGYTQVRCKNCDYKEAETAIPVDAINGHNFEMTKTKDYVCDPATQLVPAAADLEVTWKCSICQAVATYATHKNIVADDLEDATDFLATGAIPWKPGTYAKWIKAFGLAENYDGHTYSKGKDVPATCITRSGYENICTRCHIVALVENTEKDDRLNAKLVPVAAAKCTDATLQVYCEYCKGVYTAAQYGVARAAFHQAHNAVNGPTNVPNDLKTKGLFYGFNDFTGEILGRSFSDPNEAGELFYFIGAHKLEKLSEVAPGTVPPESQCVDPTVGAFLCSECGAVVHLPTAEPAGHNYTKWEPLDNTGEVWIWKHICSVCGQYVTEHTLKNHEPCADIDGDDVIDHVWVVNDKTKITECGKEYVLPATCSVCGAANPAYKFTSDDHNWVPFGAPIKVATCTETGLQKEICSFCNLSRDTVVPKTDHVPDAPIVTPATTEKEGSEVIKCKNCGTTLETKVLPKLIPELPAAKYDVKDAEYDGEAVSGKVNHVEGTKELANAFARVTFFYADGTFAVMVVPVEDGEFYAGATTATVHVAVQIVDNAKQITPPETDAIYGNSPAKMK